MDGEIGYCPLANNTVMKTFQTYDRWVYENSTGCSTVDRYNLNAQADCGMGKIQAMGDFIKYKQIVEKWPYIQNPYTLDCIVNYFPDNYNDVIKASGRITRVFLFAVVILIWIIY